MAKPSTPSREQEQVATNTVRRANFGRATRKPDPQRWNGVDK